MFAYTLKTRKYSWKSLKKFYINGERYAHRQKESMPLPCQFFPNWSNLV